MTPSLDQLATTQGEPDGVMRSPLTVGQGFSPATNGRESLLELVYSCRFYGDGVNTIGIERIPVDALDRIGLIS